MHIRDQLILVLIICSVSAEGQFSNILLKPALNLYNAFTDTDRKSQLTYQQSNNQYQPSNNQYHQTNNVYQQPYNQYQPSNIQYQPSNHQYQQTNNVNQQPSYSRVTSGSCNDYFSYQQDYGETSGKLTIPNPNYSENVVQIILSLANRLQSQYVGELSLLKDYQSSSSDVANGLPLFYRINFPIQNILPKPVSVSLNGQLICSSPKDDGPVTTTITLKHTFTTGLADRNPPRVQYSAPPTYATHQYSTARPVYTTRQYRPPATIQQTDRPPVPPVPPVQQTYENQDDNSVCGLQKGGLTQSLVIGGERSARGEWPWLVAFYRSKDGNLAFICGATLIASKFSLTAAHCIFNKDERKPLRTEHAVLYMGKYNLMQWNEEGLKQRGAKQFTLHPDWSEYGSSFDADIALIEMDSPVQYTMTIRPICLWSFDADLSKVEGRTGIIAGWGTTENGTISNDFPKKVNAPIVSNDKCLRSYDGFRKTTSDRTFCAGGRNGEGPCTGDSGGGFVLKLENRWYIRGMVSSSFINADGTSCDVKQFAVFTDVAKFTPWIKNLL